MLQSLQQSQQAGGHVPVHLSPPSGYWGSVTCTRGSSQTWLVLFLGLSQPSRHRHLAAMCDWGYSLLRQTMSWMLSV